MVKQAAKVIGLLMAVLVLLVWIVLNSHIPVGMGFGANLIAIIVAALVGLFSYVTVVQG